MKRGTLFTLKQAVKVLLMLESGSAGFFSLLLPAGGAWGHCRCCFPQKRASSGGELEGAGQLDTRRSKVPPTVGGFNAENGGIQNSETAPVHKSTKKPVVEEEPLITQQPVLVTVSRSVESQATIEGDNLPDHSSLDSVVIGGNKNQFQTWCQRKGSLVQHGFEDGDLGGDQVDGK